jgi:hypothetical protein
MSLNMQNLIYMDRWHDFQDETDACELPSAPSSKAKTTQTLITSDIRAISEGNRPGTLYFRRSRGVS